VNRSAQLHARLLNAVSDGREDDAAQASDALMDYMESFARKAMDHY
jgi:DNA-binding FadR family transcriptional regulator